MHFKPDEENRSKNVTPDPKIGQTFVWPFLIQVSAVVRCGVCVFFFCIYAMRYSIFINADKCIRIALLYVTELGICAADFKINKFG